MVSFARHTNTPIEQVKAMDVDEFVADARALARVIAAEAPKSKQ